MEQEQNKKIINGLVYRDNKIIYFVDFYTEKQIEIHDPRYQSYIKKDVPIDPHCIVLVYHFKEHGGVLKTIPIADITLEFEKKPVRANQLTIDSLIKMGYKSAGMFIRQQAEAVTPPTTH